MLRKCIILLWNNQDDNKYDIDHIKELDYDFNDDQTGETI